MALCLAVSVLAVPTLADEAVGGGEETPTTPPTESTECEHGKDPATCPDCNKETCEHGKDPATCPDCNKETCEHGKDPATCPDCNKETCEHGKDPATCPDCNKETCEHGKIPSECTVCNPPKCPHGKIPSECTVCNPSEVGKPTSGDLSYPSSVNFGTLEKNASSGSRTQTFTIKNKSDHEMKLSYSTPSGYSISGLPSSLTAGSSSTVTVQLNSASSTGNYDRRLTITASFVGGSGSNDFSISLYATVVEKGYTITVDPTSKDLGKLKEGYTEKEAKEKEITVTVQNKGASNVRMDAVKGNDHFLVTAVKSDSVTLENGDKAEYKIVPKQDLKVGTYTDTITFQTRENTSATFKATVVVEKKLAPLTVEPGTLDFGIVEEGYTALAQKTVTVKNNTEYAIRLDQPTSYSYEVSLLTQTSLPAGGSTTFTIRPRTGLPANAYNGVVELYGSGESAKVNVQFAVTKPAGPSTFSDVAAGSTFAADIAYVSQKGLMSGVGEGRFNPGAPVTRGQLVTILYRLEGQPAVSGAGFPDVAAGAYCEKSVKWAAANGITAGGKDGLFRPGDSITREQLATFLFRYNAYKGYVSTQRANLADFSDGAAVASYAKEALSWANAAKLVNGTSDGRLNPSGGATRGQAAAILHRFCVSIGR
nr:S-layer homology domain-containing protein [uncultured Oscillibacter sp.]